MNTSEPQRNWKKSTYSEQSNMCVEVSLGQEVGVRDSKNPGGPELFFTGEVWDSFLDSRIWER